MNLRVCVEIKTQIFVSRRTPDKARKHRNMNIFRVSATKLGVMHSPSKCGLIYARALRGNNPALLSAGLEILAKRYWRPVYCFLRRSGHNDADSKDLTQAFFAVWIQKNGFAVADSDKGRFRSFMLASLKRFVSNVRRADNAQRRKPAKGLLSLDALMDREECSFEPQDAGLSPERIFDRQWVVGVVMRVIRQLEMECQKTDKSMHYDIFLQRIINPVLHGAPEQPLAGLGVKHGITEKRRATTC